MQMNKTVGLLRTGLQGGIGRSTNTEGAKEILMAWETYFSVTENVNFDKCQTFICQMQ